MCERGDSLQVSDVSQNSMWSSPFILLLWNVTVSRDLANLHPLNSVIAFAYHFERNGASTVTEGGVSQTIAAHASADNIGQLGGLMTRRVSSSTRTL